MNGVKDACKRSSNPFPLLPSPQEWINKAGIVHKKNSIINILLLISSDTVYIKIMFSKIHINPVT